MNKKNELQTIDIPLEEFEDYRPVDMSESVIERRALGFILGSDQLVKNRALKERLEGKIINRIGKKGKYLTDKLFELIEGVSILYEDPKDGKAIRYYKQPPNLNAIQYAIDRILGKPTQHTESTKQSEGLITVEHIIKGLANTQGLSNKKNEGRVIKQEEGE